MMPEGNFFGIMDWINCHPEIIIPENLMLSEIQELEKILNEKDSFHRSKRVKDSHFLFYLPEGLNLKKFEELYPATNPTVRLRTYTNQERRCWYGEKNFIKEQGMGRWYLGFQKVMPDSIGKQYEESRTMIPPNYEVPTSLQAIAMHLLFAAKNGKALNPTYVGRVASVNNENRITIGRFNHLGLYIGNADDDEEDLDLGLFVFRKLKQEPKKQIANQ
ncbi:MAG: hypothetical protein WCJ57_00990 [Candidatus Falkowbacteria bacterium]